VPTPPARQGAYRGRLAPSPTGYLHLGHARTFRVAEERARAHGGMLVLRNDDLDQPRCKPQFVAAMFEDLRWLGFEWQEGPDIGGPFGPYDQSRRADLYRVALDRLIAGGFVYPCTCSRKDIQTSARAPHALDDEEPLYPGTCRTRSKPPENGRFSWRFRAGDGEVVSFADGRFGDQQFIAGRDFGDFIVWRHDDVSAYQLACTVDDALMRITEVVRGADLLLSTARQLLLYRALGLEPPQFYHCPLMTDGAGERLAKRHDSLSLRTLREQGRTPADLRERLSLESNPQDAI
jgi:glutamyl-tRNA synthetase